MLHSLLDLVPGTLQFSIVTALYYALCALSPKQKRRFDITARIISHGTVFK